MRKQLWSGRSGSFRTRYDVRGFIQSRKASPALAGTSTSFAVVLCVPAAVTA